MYFVNRDGCTKEALRLMRAARYVDAFRFAERAIQGASQVVSAHGLAAILLLKMGQRERARGLVDAVWEFDSDSPDAVDGLAHAALTLGFHVRSNCLYRRAAHMAPNEPRFAYNLACSERSLGRLAEAESCCSRAIALNAAEYPSYLLRSELLVQSSDANHLDELRAAVDRCGDDHRGRLFLGYALAKELDDIGDYDEAFRCFAEAAALRRQRLDYDVAGDELKLHRIATEFRRPTVNHTLVTNHSDKDIFVVGLPRSGTTLMERILTGIGGVTSNGETENFSQALMECSSGGEGDVFSRSARADPADVAARYIELARSATSKSKVIEKLPMNYLYIGAIHRALPRATILSIRRSPIDSCFAMYRTLFGTAYPFSYDFSELARYFKAYAGLMDHWRATLGYLLHEVVYEDLVSAPEGTASKAAHSCGLPWHSAALEVHKNSAASTTASATQARRPIYGTSSGRWRLYRHHLTPLIDALRLNGIELPADA